MSTFGIFKLIYININKYFCFYRLEPGMEEINYLITIHLLRLFLLSDRENITENHNEKKNKI